MSLFGTSPEDHPAGDSTRVKSSLFADEPATGGSSLFADDDGDDSSSPWNAQNNTAKRTARRDLARTLLPNTDVPESYIDAYDLILNSGDRVGSGIGLTSVREILSSSGLTATDQSNILNLVASGDHESFSGLGRGEFNVLLALVGLAQEGEDLSFDAVDDRRKINAELPQPKAGYLDRLRTTGDASSEPSKQKPATPPFQPPPIQIPGSTQSQNLRRTSLGGLESDPWGSPELHRGHSHETGGADPRPLNGFGSVRSMMNEWSSKAIEDTTQSNVAQRDHFNGQTEAAPLSSSGPGWGNHNFSGAGPSDENSFGGTVPSPLGGFGPTGDGLNNIAPRRRSLGLGRSTNPQVEETVTITLLPEKEGLFMFQHRNYEVKSARRGSTVIRRYSDFVWLLDCLQKRFPFRQLPLLPPKRVSVNGTHLTADSSSFLKKRRHGLVRFTNALVHHPVLGQEQLVIMFLTVPTELSVWRKQATISVQDEFVGRVLPPDLEDSLPATLEETFETVRSGVKRSAEIYINLCTLLERLAKLNDGLAADHLRFSLALQSLTEVTKNTYAVDTNDIPFINAGITATARHLSASQSLLEDEARGWTEGVLEDLKQQRDCLVSVREMFDRRDRYARNNIAQLERRIETSEQKLQDLRARPSGTVKPGEIEKVEDSIFKDKESIVQQHARGVFIRECIRDELVHFQQSQYHISRLHQDWSQELVKYSELQAENWRGLSDEVERMPTGL
ncbi:Sorting nexin mvp1 [Penicillium digitatum PHI26]|uniref:Sorting nexin MVP1 n=2 Tax=Penicillium digitatum TaxID=36651 RepID=K9GA36_PEND2|nr:Sorting nexin mvp1 [Penicillium digitatum Pd1]EKV15871.1 Sorting nexin mvp1 [Penicillium digitatum Pd1]EKV17967.1 Sorting nexin mvp1 [Penicillium digitatum PHI26]